jgi:predicted nucleotidyltransferase
MQLTASGAATQAAWQDAPTLDPEWLSRLESAWPAGAGLVFMAQTGSFMYDLHTPSSDSDFSMVYVLPTSQLVAREPPVAEFQRHAEGPFGSDKAGEVEYSGRELGSFLLELSKGNPRNVELLFTEKPHLSGALWRELRAMRSGFLTLRCVKQYLGFVAEKLRKATAFSEEGVGPGFSVEAGNKVSKSLYQGHHKLYELERVLRGESPVVALTGEERESVLRLRSQPPSSLGEARALIAEAEAWLQSLSTRAREAEATAALPAEVDAPALCGWLRSVRERLSRQAAPE